MPPPRPSRKSGKAYQPHCPPLSKRSPPNRRKGPRRKTPSECKGRRNNEWRDLRWGRLLVCRFSNDRLETYLTCCCDDPNAICFRPIGFGLVSGRARAVWFFAIRSLGHRTARAVPLESRRTARAVPLESRRTARAVQLESRWHPSVAPEVLNHPYR